MRGIVFARLANFVAGNSKARPVLAERVAALLDGPMPPVPLDGQVGAGEVLPLAHALRGLQSDDLEEGEANPVANGSPVSAALAADTACWPAPGSAAPSRFWRSRWRRLAAPLDAYDEALDEL